MSGSFRRGLLLGAGGTAAAALVGLGRNLLIARFMGPSSFGLWQVCLAALRLCGECHLGALHGVAVEAPVRRGSGDEAGARRTEAAGTTATLVLALLAGAAAGGVLLAEGGRDLGPASALLAGTVVLQAWLLADGVVLRTRRQFGRLSVMQASFAAVHLALLAWLLRERYISGALLAWAAGAGAAVAAVRVAAADPLPRPTLEGLRAAPALLRAGFVPWLASLLFVLQLQADRVVTGGLLGREALGHLGMLQLGTSALLLAPDALGGVLWPFAGERFGRSGARLESLHAPAREAVTGLALVLAPLAAVTAQSMDLLVGAWLPAYAPSLAALRPYLAGAFLLSLTVPLRLLLFTAGEGRRVLWLQAIALAAAAAGQAAAAGPWGLRGVAWAGAAAAGLLLVLLLRAARSTGVLGPGARVVGLRAGGALVAWLALDAALSALGPAALPGALLRPAIPAALALLATAWLLRRPGRGEASPPVAAGRE